MASSGRAPEVEPRLEGGVALVELERHPRPDAHEHEAERRRGRERPSLAARGTQLGTGMASVDLVDAGRALLPDQLARVEGARRKPAGS